MNGNNILLMWAQKFITLLSVTISSSELLLGMVIITWIFMGLIFSAIVIQSVLTETSAGKAGQCILILIILAFFLPLFIFELYCVVHLLSLLGL